MQWFLLKDLLNTRHCSSLLLSELPSDAWLEEVAKQVPSSDDHFKPQQFQCQLVWKKHIMPHWRLKVSKGVRALFPFQPPPQPLHSSSNLLPNPSTHLPTSSPTPPLIFQPPPQPLHSSSNLLPNPSTHLPTSSPTPPLIFQPPPQPLHSSSNLLPNPSTHLPTSSPTPPLIFQPPPQPLHSSSNLLPTPPLISC